eukprot:g6405.t1 g6405   contig23:373932-377732(-)
MVSTASLLVASLATVSGSSSAESSSSSTMQISQRRLTQHRIRAPKRMVPYPVGHPLGRHLQQHGNDEAEINQLELDEGGSDTIVGGDGWKSQQNRRRQWSSADAPTPTNEPNRFLQFLNPNESNLQNSNTSNRNRRRRRRDSSTEQEQAETLIEEKLHGGISRYWTLTGRELVNEDDYDTESNAATSDLLVDTPSSLKSGIFDNLNTAEGGGDGLDEAAERIMNYDNETWMESQYNMSLNTVDVLEEVYQNNKTVSVNGTVGGVKGLDDLQNQQTQTQESETNSEATTEEEDSLYQPIRLRAIFTDDESSGSKYLTAIQRKILMEDMINPALFGWSRALHVVPVGGGQEGRDGSEAEGGNGKLVVDQSQLYDGLSCGPGLDSGLPSVKVPEEHMTDGLADTDTVIYISVSFTDTSAPPLSSSTTIGSGWTRSSHYLHRGEPGPRFGGSMRKQDVNDTLLDAENQTSVYPSMSPSTSPSTSPSEAEPFVESRPICPGTYLASATYCSSDQYDRPVAGILSICIDNVHSFFYDGDQIKRNIVTIMHEMAHILGFNALSLAHFRDGDTGEPLTPRDKHGDVPDAEVECTGISPRTTSAIPLPSTNITKLREVRGGVRAATIVTPTVRRVVRNMFGCQTLPGAELESGEGQLLSEDYIGAISPGECIGDHWERRLFRTDLLNPIVDDVPYSLYISSLTLAYFSDSGWYKVNTDRIAPSSIWGRNAGCNFVNQKCISPDGRITAGNNPFFCNNFVSAMSEDDDEDVITEIHGCDLDSSRKAVCSLVEYDSAVPDEYNYFGKVEAIGGDHFGGSDPTLDYCPVFEGFSNGQCNDKHAKKLVGVRSNLEVFGGDNSRCVIGNVDRKRTALCLPIACVIQDQSLMVKVDGYWKQCLYAGQIISVWWNRNDYVVCPDPSHLCPTFYCPNDCFKEGGVCDYESGQCMCATSNEKPTDNNTTSWFAYYSSPLMEPCSGEQLFPSFNDTFHIAERIDVELPEYYVDNTTLLLDDPRDFDDKVSRMFAQLNSGEVVGLVASFMLFIIFSYLIWYQTMRCYREKLLDSSLSSVRASVNSLSGMLSRSSLNEWRGDNNDNGMDSPTSHRRPPGQNQKEKMVATLLVQNRIESMEQQDRLQLGGLASHDDTEKNVKSGTIVDLSSTQSNQQQVVVNRSELPPLPSGRIISVIGAQIVEDEMVEDARSSVTSATHVSSGHSASGVSDYTSPLYQDASDERGGLSLRLRNRSVARFD